MKASNNTVSFSFKDVLSLIFILSLFFLIYDLGLAQEYTVSIIQIKSAKAQIIQNTTGKQTISPQNKIQVAGYESILQDHPSQITLDLGDIFPAGVYSGPKTIPLGAFNVLAPKAKLLTSTKGENRTVDIQFASYRGSIGKDDWISLSFSKFGTMGWIRLNSRTFTIQPVASSPSEPNTREHFIIEISNQNKGGNWCGVNTESLPSQIKELMLTLSTYSKKSANTPLTAKLAVETDYETYVSFGNDSNLTTSWLLSIISAVSSIYEQEVNVKLEVVYSRVWTTSDDPYTQTGFSFFPEFENYWNANMQSIDRDAAILIIKDPSRLAGGMAALDALTDKQTAYAISGENIITVAHELGHIFGSPHTHNCSWPAGPGGTLAPIDKCATVEGDCNITEIVPQEGTIMSYCPTTTQTFGTLVNNLIRARAESKLGAGDLEVSTVTGKVTMSGSGIANINIKAVRGDGSTVSVATAEDGSYSMNLFYDDYTISADKDGYLIKPIGLTSGSIYVNVATSPVTGLNFNALVLNADQYEPDDNYSQAVLIPVDGSIQQHTLHNINDIDYIKFNAISGKSYFIALKLNSVLGYPSFNLLDTDGVTTLQSASGTPYMVWQAPKTGNYYLKIAATKGFYGVLVTLAPFLKASSGIAPLSWSAADWGDYDGDGDLDLLLAGMDDNNTFKVLLFRNDNGNLTQTDAGIDQTPTANYILMPVVKWVDIDNDGDLDAFIGGGNFAYIYINFGGYFTSKIIVDDNLVDLESAEFGDYDNDGDLDILVQSSVDFIYQGDVALIHLYRNNNGTFQNLNLGLRGVRSGRAIWGDFDGDGDLDILVTGASNVNQVGGSSSEDYPFTKIYQNINGSFSEANVNIVPLASFPDLALGDYDNDGNLDLAIAGQDSSELIARIYHYDNGKYTDINAGLTGVHNVSLKWGDYDNDGDLDLIITGQETLGAGYSPLTKLYINNGDKFEEANFNSIFPDICIGTVTWSDYDKDSDLDLLLVGEAINAKALANLLTNETSTKNLPPSAPTGLNAFVEGNKVTLSWIQSQDDKTPSKGLTYNLCIGTAPGGVDFLAPMSNIETGNRQIVDFGNAGHLTQHTLKNLPPKTYYWSVQAIDNSYSGGPFAPIQSFDISTSTSVSHVNDAGKELRVYPNPANDIMNIEFIGNEKETGFEIYNSIGQIVFRGRIVDKTFIHSISFSPGVYLIKLDSGKNVHFIKI